MRMNEISPPTSHPYVAEVTIDPADWPRMGRMIDEARELRLLDLDDSQPDEWTARIGCASRRVQETVAERWG